MKILLVEDDNSWSKLVTAILQKRGHEVTEVTNSDAALQQLVDTEFDAVVTDFDLGNFSENGLKVVADAQAFLPAHGVVILWSAILRDVEARDAVVQPDFNLSKMDIDEMLSALESGVE